MLLRWIGVKAKWCCINVPLMGALYQMCTGLPYCGYRMVKNITLLILKEVS
uniref:Uncharacterized protein n=1 Tax=Magallana gigas TaxID=29159 RepID=K1Q2U6_MAGGI